MTTAFEERQAIIAYIRKREASVAALVKRGRLTEDEGSVLSRCLGTLAEDIDQQLHDEDDGE